MPCLSVSDYLAPTGTANPTAVAYSLLDVVQPAMEEGDDYYEHWILSHFLLDGHHKVEAAAISNKPVRILSLLDEQISIATPDDITMLTEVRGQAREYRG